MFPFFIFAVTRPVSFDSWSQLWITLAIAVVLYGGAAALGWWLL